MELEKYLIDIGIRASDHGHIIDNEEGEARFGAYDAQGNPICYSHESLWEYLENNCKTYTVKRHKK